MTVNVIAKHIAAVVAGFKRSSLFSCRRFVFSLCCTTRLVNKVVCRSLDDGTAAWDHVGWSVASRDKDSAAIIAQLDWCPPASMRLKRIGRPPAGPFLILPSPPRPLPAFHPWQCGWAAEHWPVEHNWTTTNSLVTAATSRNECTGMPCYFSDTASVAASVILNFTIAHNIF